MFYRLARLERHIPIFCPEMHFKTTPLDCSDTIPLKRLPRAETGNHRIPLKKRSKEMTMHKRLSFTRSAGGVMAMALAAALCSCVSTGGIDTATRDEPIIQDMFQIRKPEMNDAKLEAAMLALAKKTVEKLNKDEPQYYRESALKVIIADEDWSLVRNDIDIIKGRMITAQIIGQTKADNAAQGFKAGDHFFRTWTFYQSYVGGDFLPALQLYGYAGYGHGGRRHVPESNALDAMDGNFDFTM